MSWRAHPVLVTGGGGFIGGAIVRRLCSMGLKVRSVSRNSYPALAELGVEQVQGDLADRATVREALDGCGAVFHVAAMAGIWGDPKAFHRSNVLATQNLLAGCRELGVTRFVFTSSPSVAQTDSGCAGGDESQPIPDQHRTDYQATKAQSEKMVLDAYCEALRTVALRPRLVWGPGDPHLLPRLVDRSRSGRLAMVGGGDELIDSSYIENVVDAHLLAADALDQVPSPCAGKAYFISNGEPRPMSVLINQLLSAAGAPVVHKKIPVWVAVLAGTVLEGLWSTLPLKGEPPMTRFLAYQLSTPNWYELGNARRDLGYEPKVSLDEGLDLLAEHWSNKEA
jgi:nucleoside-diphosphate-sugar epimerase